MFSQICSSLNWLHILVATVAYFAVGAVWYSALFTKQWVTLHKIDMNNPDSKKGVGLIFTGGFILTIVIVAGLAFLQHALQAVDAIGGVKLGLFVSVLFSSTAIGINYLYLKKPFMLFVIDCGYHIVSCIIAGIILAAWH